MTRSLRAAAVALGMIATMLLGAGVANAATYSFACKPPQFVGSGPCGGPFVVRANDIVRVNLVSSGGHKVLFYAYVDGSKVGETDLLDPGAAEAVAWQNNTGHDVTVQMYAKTAYDDYEVQVLAKGNYRVEP
ncbi:MAG: hypothetical protein ACT4RN_08820 [Pseudonocardia sp.]